jgi:hypothetical protein
MPSPSRNSVYGRFSTDVDLTDDQRHFIQRFRAGWERWAAHNDVDVSRTLPVEDDVHVFRTRREMQAAMRRRGIPVDGREVAVAIGPPFGVVVAADSDSRLVLGHIADGMTRAVTRHGTPLAGSTFGNCAFAAVITALILRRYCEPGLAKRVQPAHVRPGIVADELARTVSQRFVATPNRLIDEIARAAIVGPGYESWAVPALRATLGGGDRWQIFVDFPPSPESYRRMLQLAEALQLPGAVRRLQALHRSVEAPGTQHVAHVGLSTTRPEPARPLTVQEQRLLDATVRPDAPREWQLPPDERPSLLEGARDLAIEGVVGALGKLNEVFRDVASGGGDGAGQPSTEPRPPVGQSPTRPVRVRPRLNERNDTDRTPTGTNRPRLTGDPGNERQIVHEPPVSAAWPEVYQRPTDPRAEDERGQDVERRAEAGFDTSDEPGGQTADERRRTEPSGTRPAQPRPAQHGLSGETDASGPDGERGEPGGASPLRPSSRKVAQPAKPFEPRRQPGGTKPSAGTAHEQDEPDVVDPETSSGAGERRRWRGHDSRPTEPPAGGSVFMELITELQERENDLSIIRTLVSGAREKLGGAGDSLREAQRLAAELRDPVSGRKQHAELSADAVQLAELEKQLEAMDRIITEVPKTLETLSRARDHAEGSWRALQATSRALVDYTTCIGLPLESDQVTARPYVSPSPEPTPTRPSGFDDPRSGSESRDPVPPSSNDGPGHEL